MNRQEVISWYQGKLDEQQQIVGECLSRWRAFSYLRGGTFILSVVPFFLGLAGYSGYKSFWFVLAGVLFLAFLVFAFIHEGIQSQVRIATLLSSMHRESLARLGRRWKEIRVPAMTVPKKLSALSSDLDLFTESSIFKLMGTVRTPDGIEKIQHWIIDGADVEEIKARQAAVAELKPEFDWRLKFNLKCEQLGLAKSGPSGFVRWAESPGWFGKRGWILAISRLTSVVSIVAIAGLLLGFLSIPVAGVALAISCGINFLLSIVFAGALHDIFNQISSEADEALHFVNLFEMVSRFPAKSEKLKSLQQGLNTHGRSAHASMSILSKRIWLANIRRQGILFIPYLIFEFLFFWDVHCLHFLERWKLEHGQDVPRWFSDLGEWEGLCALAKLAGDEPEWQFPTVFGKVGGPAQKITAKQLAHPLLDERRVANDVEVGPPGSVLLVTGSNMSGKSTLLRSIGLNAVLAQMGSVVCAQSMSLPLVRIETSMRIADSLADGVSFFMAELKRLKDVVDVAQSLSSDSSNGNFSNSNAKPNANANSNSRTMMFLLDEILQGTNSRERQIAVSRVVRRLIDYKAIGAISTHDLDLARTDELKDACDAVHFSEQFVEIDGRRQMTFDYRMKQGIAETTNALKLLEMVGLGD